ncbi:MAG: TetR/AcrR family transcriptional regulator [Solirubrobacterales bacterium]|nr:TetR/AcrR family transcriptional regulator [Solirubrobacterales bacterium]
MIYYYYESKEQLFIAVLERAYAGIRRAEQSIDVANLDPIAAIRRLAELTFDYHQANPDFARLVSIENIHGAKHLRSSAAFARLNSPVIELISQILDRGRAAEIFVRPVDAIDLHMMISAFCVFRIANHHTFGQLFGRDLTSPARGDHYRRMLCDMVVAYLTVDLGPPASPAAPR